MWDVGRGQDRRLQSKIAVWESLNLPRDGYLSG
jgi:hypothetical protein